MAHLAIIAASGVVTILLLTLIRPVHTCPGCGGRKVIRHGRSFRPCKRCKGTGKAYRRGAVLMHRLLREHAWPWLRDRITDAIADRIGGDS
jgi:hypothetical protein